MSYYLPDLEMACSKCFGRRTPRGQDEPCKQCEGYGYHLTREGKRLVEFLQRRGLAFPMSPLAEEELRGMVE